MAYKYKHNMWSRTHDRDELIKVIARIKTKRLGELTLEEVERVADEWFRGEAHLRFVIRVNSTMGRRECEYAYQTVLWFLKRITENRGLVWTALT